MRVANCLCEVACRVSIHAWLQVSNVSSVVAVARALSDRCSDPLVQAIGSLGDTERPGDIRVDKDAGPYISQCLTEDTYSLLAFVRG